MHKENVLAKFHRESGWHKVPNLPQLGRYRFVVYVKLVEGGS